MSRDRSLNDLAAAAAVGGDVKNHMHHVLEKLQVHSRGQALTRLRESANESSPAFDLAVPGDSRA